ncbi:MAG: hypothetical protein C0616_01160 [Desulfuromonas sp.]|mgnify:CR=1 FL=1|nr:MAG: hypothetical protein C0616_01160 [Desulfuromonas sp.]
MFDAIAWTPGFSQGALFLVSFLAATVLPLGSEWLLAAMILQGQDPVGCVLVATSGNSLGALTTYAIGLWGGTFFVERVLSIDAERRQKAERLYERLGSWSLLLSWVPIVGDPLCLLGGVLRVGLARFVLLVTAGKLARYAAVGYLVYVGI